MIKNYIKIAVRHLFKNKLNTFINIIGLALGISTSIVMFLYTANELSYNSNFKKADRIYMVYKERHLPTGMQVTRDTWFPMADALQQKYPDVEASTHLWDEDAWVQSTKKKFKMSVTYAKQNIFDVFSFPLLNGDINSFTKDINTAIISQETADKFFGDENPIGKTLTLNYKTDYIVRGVFDKIPRNSTYRPEIMIPSNSAPWYGNVKDFWGSSWLDTYVLLKKNVSPGSFESQLPAFVKNDMGKESAEHLTLKLTALPDLYNETTNANTYAYILFAVAFSILIIASINFMNIATVKSLERSKEIGVQKVLGASRKQLVKRYLSESVLVSFTALVIGILLTSLYLPYFDKMYNLDLSLFSYGIIPTAACLVLLGIFVGVISGIYPAFVITKFKPVETFGGKIKHGKTGFSLRSVLVVSQFVLTTIMFIGTSIVVNQIEYMKNANLNISKSNLMVISVRNGDFPDPEIARQKIETFKSELESYSGVAGVASSSMSIPSEGGGFTFIYPTDRPEDQRLRERWMVVDENFFDVYGIKMLDGRNFSKDIETDKEDAVIINEAALKDIGWKNINEGEIKAAGKSRKIIGLVKDYNYQSLESGIEPMIHIYRPSGNNIFRYITVKILPGNISGVIDYVKEKWKEVDQSAPVSFRFVDESFSRLYETQDRLAIVAKSFTIVALIISCLGLFALSALMLTYRTKEIGIRKVLGASVNSLLVLISKEFIKWIVISNLIAWPVAWFLMKEWLQDFAYRIPISIIPFLISGIIVLLIAWVSISFITIKAALENPVKSLKYE